jgi:hypothetical protein
VTRVRTSEPAWRAPATSMQTERARGTIIPLDTPRQSVAGQVIGALFNPDVPRRERVGSALIAMGVFATGAVGLFLSLVFGG